MRCCASWRRCWPKKGIGLSGDDPPDLATLQAALNRAVERRNLELFSPVGATRQIAVDALHRVVDAVLAGDSAAAGRLLEQIQPESPDNTVATVSSCIGIALGLLDDTLTASSAPIVALPAGHWNGERAATDILALARKGKAFRSLDKLLIRQGGPQGPQRISTRPRRHRRRGRPNEPHNPQRHDSSPHPLTADTVRSTAHVATMAGIRGVK